MPPRADGTRQGHRKDGTFKKSKYGKYNANGRYIDDIYFHSAAEGDRYLQLKEMEKAAIIRRLECQPRFPISVNGVAICTYIADFRYQALSPAGTVVATIVEDVKGMRTPEYILKSKLYEAVYRTKIHEIEAGKIKHTAGLPAHKVQ